MISFNSESMATDLPLPPNTEDVQYNDSAKRLSFLAALTPDDVAEFYRKALAPTEWSTTMAKPDKSDFVYSIIFQSPKGEMIRIEMVLTDEKLRTTVLYSAAEEVSDEKQRVAVGMASLREKLAKEAAAPKATVSLKLPTGTTSKALTKTQLKLNLPANKGKAAVEALRKALVSAGWKETAASIAPVGGTVTLTKEDRALTILYMDPGFMPAEITANPSGVEIKLAE